MILNKNYLKNRIDPRLWNDKYIVIIDHTKYLLQKVCIVNRAARL